MLVDRGEDALQRRLAREGATALVDVSLKLVSEARHVACDRHGRRVSERTQAIAEDPVADVEEHVELALSRVALLDLPEELHHPASSLPARRALSARLVHVELRDTQ